MHTILLNDKVFSIVLERRDNAGICLLKTTFILLSLTNHVVPNLDSRKYIDFHPRVGRVHELRGVRMSEPATFVL